MRKVLIRIRLGGCSGLSEYSLGAQVILLDLPCSSSFIFHNGKKCTDKLLSMSAIYFILQNDFRHILSYKRAVCVTKALKW